MVAADILAAVDMAVVDKVAEDMVVVGREPAGGKVQHDVHMVVVGLAVCKVGVLLHLVHLEEYKLSKLDKRQNKILKISKIKHTHKA